MSSRIIVHPAGFEVVEIDNKFSRAKIAALGAHLFEYVPHGIDPVIWVSRESNFTPGKAIRGGIPVCTPYFGRIDAEHPSHGVARTAIWQISDVRDHEDGASSVRLASEFAGADWHPAFAASMRFEIGSELKAQLEIRNLEPVEREFSGALHTYFAVSEITQVAVSGFDGCPYADKAPGADPTAQPVQHGDVTFQGEVDRIYYPCAQAAVIHDPGFRRDIVVEKSNSNSTVVWNPWVDKSRKLPDFGNDEYHTMLCIESTHAGADVRRVPAGGTLTLGQKITVKLWQN